MRYHDLSNPLLEGMRYGGREKQWVMNNLSKFNLGIEIELKYDSRGSDLGELDFSRYDEKDNPILRVLKKNNLNSDEFVDKIASALTDLYRDITMVDNNPLIDGFDDITSSMLTVSRLGGDNPLINLLSLETFDEKVNACREIKTRVEELSYGAEFDDYEFFINEASTAIDEVPFYGYAFDGHTEALEALLDAYGTLVYLLDESTDEKTMSDLEASIETLVDSLDLIDDDELKGIPWTTLLNNGLPGVIPGLIRHKVTFPQLYNLLIEDNSKSFYSDFFIKLGLPVDSITDVFDIPNEVLGFPRQLIQMISNDVNARFNFDYRVIDEHDNQIEIITQNVASGGQLAELFEEAYSIIDHVTKTYGFYTSKMSGLHLSISINSDQPVNVPKFMVLSQLLTLIPKDASRIRTFVTDINVILRDNLPSLLMLISREVGTGNIATNYTTVLETWLDKVLRGTKQQSINFTDIDVMNGRIELRFPGGEGYEKQKTSDWELLVRSLYALGVAYDPDLMQRQYVRTMDGLIQKHLNEYLGMSLHRYVQNMKRLTDILRDISGMPNMVIPHDKPAMKIKKYFKLVGELGNIPTDIVTELMDTVVDVDGRAFVVPDESIIRKLSSATLTEETEPTMRLKNIIEIKVGDKNAEFWITRRGSKESVGKVLTEYDPEAYGITIKNKKMLDPSYARYMFEYLYQSGLWGQLARGTLSLVNLRMSDVLNVPIESV